MNNVPVSSRSYEKVNYLLRPRKQIERKILIDMLKGVKAIHSYHYIGLGSIFYYDFILFHKYLNIKKMTSLDDKPTIKRFRFNRPYDFIGFVPKRTTDFLKEHNFRQKTIIWFDYDSKLYDFDTDLKNDSMLEDIQILTSKAYPGTFFLVTIDIRPPTKPDEQKLFLRQFDLYLPSEYKQDVYRRENAKFISDYRYMIQVVILNFMEEEAKFCSTKFHKLFSFYYRDTAPMYTLGGVYHDQKGFEAIKEQLIGNEFVNTIKSEITDIDVPILTYKEKIQLDSELRSLRRKLKVAKNRRQDERILQGLKFEIESPDMLKKYLEYSRYYPQYYEGII